MFHLKSCEQPQLNPFTRQCKFVLTFKLLLTSYLLNHKRCKLSHGVTPLRSISSPSPLSYPCIEGGSYTPSVPLNMSQFGSCLRSLAIKFLQGYILEKRNRNNFAERKTDKSSPNNQTKIIHSLLIFSRP